MQTSPSPDQTSSGTANRIADTGGTWDAVAEMFVAAEKMRGTLKSRGGKPGFTADTDNVEMFMKLLLWCNLCVSFSHKNL